MKKENKKTGMKLDKTEVAYEDELPFMTDEEYRQWFKESRSTMITRLH